MSNVAVEAEVIQSTHLLVSRDLGHNDVGVLLVSPLFAQQLIQVDGLKCTHLGRFLDQFF